MSSRLVLAVVLAFAVGLAAAVSPYASSSPDGLNKVAVEHGFAGEAEAQDGPIAGYAFPGVENEKVAKGLAGFVGTLVVFGTGYLLIRGVRWRHSPST